MSSPESGKVFQRILPGFQGHFLGRTRGGGMATLGEEVLGIPVNIANSLSQGSPSREERRLGNISAVISTEPSEEKRIKWRISRTGNDFLVLGGDGRWRAVPALTALPISPDIITSGNIHQRVNMKGLRENLTTWQTLLCDHSSPEKAAKYKAAFARKLEEMELLSEGGIIEGAERWEIEALVKPAKSIMARLGVIAFVLGRPDAENLFEIRGSRIQGKREIPVDDARKLLSFFTGEKAIPLFNPLFQFANARKILFNYLKLEE